MVSRAALLCAWWLEGMQITSLHVSKLQVDAEATKLGAEASEANAIALECQSSLEKALPALQTAEAALIVLTKKDITELKVHPVAA